ncbi:hypothetical protein BABINDRAFT_33398 [Babjeviella inositovora NRRL Y-12698]|uniref:Exonuclease domain-containing protein n=1 Tax=Babjeviella inositovora NRRL Y-12698 TaxID=984486 RepID=A0A1E3QWV8_9ASCO|nr:uncharacterized protein BABINDRAFT_33398 [Babjeviella inositovora NRRL Y-12698]ODQ82146.1 hypothetical protein BABINDRAFT_33398 [Babjeviella inositovora NRRL Y-12698]
MTKPKRRRSSVQSLSATRKKKFLVPPTIKYDPNYARKKISVSDLRDLILHMLCESYLNIPPPTWCTVTNRAQIQHVVFLFVPGLQPRHFGHTDFVKTVSPQRVAPPCEPREDMPFFRATFDTVWPVVAPGSKETLFSSMHALTNVPLTKKEKDKLKRDPASTKRLVLPDLLMTHGQMTANEYPIHSEMGPEGPKAHGWVETVKFFHEGSHTFALDCEMCLSASGKVLTRISLVDFNDKVLIDEYVKPAEPIVDYLTRYSGISEAILANVTTTLADVQQLLLRTISADDVLIGHSLESDLNVLKVTHPRIIDTSIVYEHVRGPPAKASLKHLASKYLNREIQNNGIHGHSSVEDSQACMDLVKLKLVSGDAFGRNVSDISLFKKLHSDKKRPNRSLVLDGSSVRAGAPTSAETRVRVACDDELVSELLANIEKYDFVLGKLRDIEYASNSPEGVAFDKDLFHEKIAALDARLSALYASLPNDTALLICSGNGDVTDLVRIQNQKRDFQRENEPKRWDEVKDVWNQQHLEALKRATETARDAVFFMTMKSDGSLPESSPSPVDSRESSLTMLMDNKAGSSLSIDEVVIGE